MLVRALLAVVCVFALGACALSDRNVPAQPTFYRDMASSEAQLDAESAASMISGYRQNNGLNAVTVDPALMRLAQEQAHAMAARDKLDHGFSKPMTERLRAGGYDPKLAVENVSAGYHTMAEAFSGWRDSPPHRANMLRTGVTRMGIAAAYAPGSKYKVYWAMILAVADERS